MADKTESQQSSQNSQLFVLRLWLEDLGSRKLDWRGKVQDVKSGEVRYFRDWATLEAFIDGQMQPDNPEEDHPGGIRETGRGENDHKR